MGRFRFNRKGKKKAAAVKGKVSEAVKKYVKSTISRDVENKYILQDGAAVTPVPYTGTKVLLSHNPAITQGTGSNQRIGDDIYLKRLNLRLLFSTPSTYNSYCRVMLIKYKEMDGRDLLTGDFMNVSSAGYGPDRPLFPPHVVHEKVQILYDKMVHVTATGNITADENFKHHIINMPLNWKQSYLRGATAGTYADLATNGLYLVLFGSHDSGSVARCNLRDIQWTVEYEDA